MFNPIVQPNRARSKYNMFSRESKNLAADKQSGSEMEEIVCNYPAER